MNSTQCYHCGDSCDDNLIQFDDKNFCCNGCKTVYEIFSENDLTCYYDLQNSPGAIPKEIKLLLSWLILSRNSVIVELCH